MAAGDIILSDGTTITAADIQQIAAEVKKELAAESKELSQFEEVTSLANVSSLPGIQQSGATMKLVRVALEVLKGVDGKDVELTASQTAIQWRYVGESEWKTLVELSLLKGDKGDEGEKVMLRKGTSGIEWKYEDDGSWQTLIPIEDLAFDFEDLTSEQKESLTRKPILTDVTVTGSTSNPSGSFTHTGDDSDGNPEYSLSLSLPKGDKGEPPTLEVGTVSTGNPGTDVKVSLTPDGETSSGSPKYKLNITIPRGNPGMDGTGTGNVLVESYSSLEANKQYSFQPSADGSVHGAFVETRGAVDIYPYLQDYWGEDDGEFSISQEHFDSLKGLIKSVKNVFVYYNSISDAGVFPAYIRQNGTSENSLFVNVTLNNSLYSSRYLEFSLDRDSTCYRRVCRYAATGLAGEYNLIGNYNVNKPSEYSALVGTDSVNKALGKLEAGVVALRDDKKSVKVTNASGLVSSNYYSFNPSADGSLEGTFSVIPEARENRNGLMSSVDYRKLDNMKSVISLPVEVLGYNAETTSETILSMLQTAFEKDSAANVAYIFMLHAASLQGEYLQTMYKFYIGDRECMLGGNVVTDGSSISQATLEFSYVDGGKLHTVAITLVVGAAESGGSKTYTFSAKVLESGDDTYYLPANIFDLTESSTAEDVFEMFGGAEEFKKLWTYVPGRKFYIPYSTGNKNNFASYIPASVRTLCAFLYQIDITALEPCGLTKLDYRIQALMALFNYNDWTLSLISKKTVYPSGYSLPASIYALTSSSTSDEISTAVGGEPGLKEIIQAVKDGNRLVIRGTLDDLAEITINQDVQCSMYQEADNGDMALLLSGRGYLLWGTTGGILNIMYTKSSNTFSCKAVTD